MRRIQVIDSHTGGEPTRVVVGGAPDLGSGTVAERAKILIREFDHFRSVVVNEPRGSEVIVGAILCEPADPTCTIGVIFFNNVGPIGMCGHGTIGLVATLAYMGRIQPGEHRIETTVGVVTATLHTDRRVTVRNVPSYRFQSGIQLVLPSGEQIVGDVAWGGNWFFLAAISGVELSIRNTEQLSQIARSIRREIERKGVTGRDDGVIDHIEIFGPPGNPANHSRNFVLCPGLAYDRSPCGTGTSAKLACLHAEGKLQTGGIWRQEGILGSVFEGTIELTEQAGVVIPSITGSAFVTAETTLLVDPHDPFPDGIRAE